MIIIIVLEGLAIDWLNDRIYWTDSELNRVEVANIDGTKRAVLFSGLNNPRDIIVDPINKLVGIRLRLYIVCQPHTSVCPLFNVTGVIMCMYFLPTPIKIELSIIFNLLFLEFCFGLKHKRLSRLPLMVVTWSNFFLTFPIIYLGQLVWHWTYHLRLFTGLMQEHVV